MELTIYEVAQEFQKYLKQAPVRCTEIQEGRVFGLFGTLFLEPRIVPGHINVCE
jgi:hypothetical protein